MNELASIITHFRLITRLPRATRSHFDKKERSLTTLEAIAFWGGIRNRVFHRITFIVLLSVIPDNETLFLPSACHQN